MARTDDGDDGKEGEDVIGLVVAVTATGVRELVREVTKVTVAGLTCRLRSANHSLTCTAVP